ncbi:MAG TPA: PP2C family serine/threonine-protein phosphatase, partial [Planctomycetota bacterium]|nr:PP2C family serine/threonine-protein phosphatase [Planctomycetota bacterium]
ADGMGGRLYGEVASEMAVEILARHIRDDFPESYRRLSPADQAIVVVNLLDEWIRDVNARIWKKGREDERYREMGTTLVALVQVGKTAVLAHVGDSRCYRSRNGRLEQLTEDHSLVNSQVKEGRLTAEEARESAQKNIITRAVGTANAVKADVKVLPLEPGDRFLMCSDGLSDMLVDDRLAGVLGGPMSLEQMARTLVKEANDAGGRDNITAVIGENRA